MTYSNEIINLYILHFNNKIKIPKISQSIDGYSKKGKEIKKKLF